MANAGGREVRYDTRNPKHSSSPRVQVASTLDREPRSLHLITLCVGFIIAYGLLQLVEWFRRRRRDAEEAAGAAAKASDAERPRVDEH